MVEQVEKLVIYEEDKRSFTGFKREIHFEYLGSDIYDISLKNNRSEWEGISMNKQEAIELFTRALKLLQDEEDI